MSTFPNPVPQAANVDSAEVAKFATQATDWWDPTGPMATLHAINPLRLNWIDQQAGLCGKRVLDVGCGAGILAESMALRGARVTATDAGAEQIEAARSHMAITGVEVDYQVDTAEGFAARDGERFDVVTCMEMLEHVPDPESAVAALSRLTAPGGSLFLSTISRTPRAFAEAIVAAEYLLRLLPAGTHEYARFIRPSELAAVLRAQGLEVRALTGLTYSPLSRRYRLTPTVDVNYMLHAFRPPGAEDGEPDSP